MRDLHFYIDPSFLTDLTVWQLLLMAAVMVIVVCLWACQLV